MLTNSVTTDPPIPPDPKDSKPAGERLAEERKQRFLHLIVIPLVVGVVLLVGSPWWYKAIFGSGSAGRSAIAGFSGGCSTYEVYSENRWAPVGTAIRAQPSVLSTQEGSFAPNSVIRLNGWVHGEAAYPTNVTPYNSNIWFHLSDGAGWVSFPGVRAKPTTFDPTGMASGGPPAPTPAKCLGTVA